MLVHEVSPAGWPPGFFLLQGDILGESPGPVRRALGPVRLAEQPPAARDLRRRNRSFLVDSKETVVIDYVNFAHLLLGSEWLHLHSVSLISKYCREING